MMLMEVKQAAVSGGDLAVLPVSFSLAAGRPFTLLGETGSGKSLLVQAVNGLLPRELTSTGKLQFYGQQMPLASRPVRSPFPIVWTSAGRDRPAAARVNRQRNAAF